MKLITLSTVALGAMTCAALAQQAAVETFEGPVQGSKGEIIGKLAIRSGQNSTVVRLQLSAGSLTPGWHGIHFHAVGNCSDPGKFEMSKAHVNPESLKHGLLNPDGPDEGDLPNIYINADGSANAEVVSDLPLSGTEGLKDSDGSALIIHAREDDHTSQPIGNAGERVACAVIK